MKKYSVLEGVDILKKYNIPDFKVTINSRAKRVVRSDGTIKCGFDYNNSAENKMRDYSFHSSATIFTGAEDFSIEKFSDSIQIVVPQVVVSAYNEFIHIKEVRTPVLVISETAVSCPFKRPSYGQEISESKIWEFIENNYDDFCNGPIEKEKIQMCFSMMQFFGIKISSGPYSSLLSLISVVLAGFPNVKFFLSEEYKNYQTTILSDVLDFDFYSAIQEMVKNKKPVDSIQDILKQMEIPVFLKSCFENSAAKKFLKCNRWNVEKSYLFTLDKYPLSVQNILLHHCLGGDINLENLSHFAKNYTEDMFKDEETILAFRKFLIKDYKRSEIGGFLSFMQKVNEFNVPLSSKTANIRFVSTLNNRKVARMVGILPDRLDVFEEMIEKDVLKAYSYLKKDMD